eukprot:COSAG01_NODE_29758_length_630_cov_1.045198_1_plen_44_part_10
MKHALGGALFGVPLPGSNRSKVPEPPRPRRTVAPMQQSSDFSDS